MSNKIKGITLEIGGDTAGLTKALSKVNKETGTIQRELKEIEKALKLDPKNTELLTQKQKLLSDSIDVTEKKVEALKKAKAKADKDMADGTEVNQEQYRKLQREIVKTESALEDVKKQSVDVEKKLKGVRDPKTANDSAAGFLNMKTAIFAGGAAAVVAGKKILDMGFNAAAAADDINTLATQTGLSTDQIQIFKYASDRIDVSLKTLTGSLAKLTKNMYSASQGSKNQQKAFDALGISITDSEGKLRNNQDVMNDAIDALSKMENETQRDAYAMQLFGKSAQDLNPLILGGADALKTMAQEARDAGLILDEETLQKANKLNDAVDKLKATTDGAFAKIGSEIAQNLTPVIEPLSGLIADVSETASETLSKMRNENSEVINTVYDLSEAYESSMAAIDERTVAQLAEVETVKRLYAELCMLVDANGEIDQADRTRAEFIAGELSKALGTEISLNGDVRKTINDISKSVGEYIKQRQIQILLDSQEDKYIEARERRKEAIEAETAAYQAMVDYVAAHQDGMTFTEQLEYNSLVAACQTASETVQGYSTEVQNYYDATAAAAEDNLDKLRGIVDGETTLRADAAELAGKTEAEKKAIMQGEWEKTLIAYNNALERYKDAPTQHNKELVQQAAETAIKAGEEYKKVGGAIPAGIAQGLEAAKQGLMNTAKALVGDIKKIIAGKAGLDVNSPSKWAEAVAEFTDEGLAKGFINKAGVVTDAAGNVVSGVKAVIVEGNEELLEEEQKYLDEKQRLEDEDAAKQKKTAEQIQKEKNKIYLDGLKEAADIAKKERKQIRDAFGDMVSDVQKNIANVEKEMTSFRNKLAKIDELAVVPTTTFTGLFGGDDLVVEGTPKLADLSGRIAELTKYHDNLTTLKDMGVDDSLLEEIKSRGEEEGGLFMEAFLNSTDEERDLFLSQYEEIGKLSGKTAGEMFQTEIEEATKGLSDVFAEMNPDMLKVGEDWGTVLGEGITTKIKEALEKIKGMVGMTDYAPNAGVVYQTQITQHITSTPQTAYESAEQTRRVMENLDSQAVLS